MLFQVVKDCGRAYKALEISTIVDNNNQGGNVYSEKTLNEVREKANEILTK